MPDIRGYETGGTEYGFADLKARAALGGVEIAADMTALAASTADRVLVLKDDSNWGTGGPCWFQKSVTWTTYAYQRTDGSKVYPVPDQAQLQADNAPKEQLMNVLYTWIGNLNLHHGESYNNDLFSANCAKDSDDLFEMDCSAFVSAVLLGITYENSRYVLGQSADNVELQYMSDHLGPSKSSYMPKGGLGASEMAMWFAQRGQLHTLPLDNVKCRDMLQFGDILFGSNWQNPSGAYYDIEHCAFVLGVAGKYVVTAESLSRVDDNEPQNLQIVYRILDTEETSSIGTYLKLFARPNYRELAQTPAITPYQGGTFKYNGVFLPMAGIRRSNDSSGEAVTVPLGAVYRDARSMATLDYLPVVPGSTLDYIGSEKNSREKYYLSIRCYEYDDTYKLAKTTSLAFYSNGTFYRNPLTLGETTKYVRFMANYSSSSTSAAYASIYLRDQKDFAMKITPPEAPAAPAGT